MAWTTPRTWTTSETVTAAMMNAHVRDNLAYLKVYADSKTVYLKCVYDYELLVADGTNPKIYFTVPSEINGMNLISAHASVVTASSSGTPTVQVKNITDNQQMLSTSITIDANEKTSYTAAAQPVVNASYDDVVTGDLIGILLTVAGTGTKGLDVILSFRTP